tara:strand:+ start:357 stop:677 length:321 start_codon:yes stop_codon:yes gene_type:complete
MGYISFKKAGGEVDLLPADNIVHVGTASATAIVITFGSLAFGATGDSELFNATVTYDTTASVTNPNVRGLVNEAISKAAGTSSGAIKVGLPTNVTSIVIDQAATPI